MKILSAKYGIAKSGQPNYRKQSNMFWRVFAI